MAEFQQIDANGIGITAAGGLVDLSRSVRNNQTGAADRREYLAMRPEIARRVAAALLKAADAADGLPSGFEAGEPIDVMLTAIGGRRG